MIKTIHLFLKISTFKVDKTVGQKIFKNENVIDAFAVVVTVKSFWHRQSKKSVAFVVQKYLRQNKNLYLIP